MACYHHLLNVKIPIFQIQILQIGRDVQESGVLIHFLDQHAVPAIMSLLILPVITLINHGITRQSGGILVSRIRDWTIVSVH